MKVIDTRGLICPAPLVKTRQGLNSADADEQVRILIDNPASFSNVKRYLADNSLDFSVTEEHGLWTITVKRGEGTEVKANETEYCTIPAAKDPSGRKAVIAVASDKMGEGDNELGEKLMLTFFKMLVLQEPAPASVVFYNSGVRLALDDSPVLVYLRELAEKGTGLYLCTTCINHFGIKDRLPLGSFSDMYQIMNILRDADHIIRP